MSEKEIAKIEKLIVDLTNDVTSCAELEKTMPDETLQRIQRQHGIFLTNNIDRLKELYNEVA